MKHWITGTIKKIKRIFAYIPFIWNNEDYDYYHLLDLIHFKIDRMIRQFEKDKEFVSVDQELKQLKRVSTLLKALKEDQYENSFYEAHDKKWGQLHHKFESIEGNTNSRMIFWRDNANTPELEELETKELREGLKMAEMKYKKASRVLFKTFAKYMRRWWT